MSITHKDISFYISVNMSQEEGHPQINTMNGLAETVIFFRLLTLGAACTFSVNPHEPTVCAVRESLNLN